MKILVLGAEGMLGHKMLQILGCRYPETYGTIFGNKQQQFYQKIDLFQDPRVIDRVDATDFEALGTLVKDVRPDAIVNCIGIVKQRDEATSAIPSITTNSLLPHRLHQITRENAARLIHFSTDCVFSGHRGNYREDDPSDAEDLYGKTKYLGEVRSEGALTLRTSIVGRELANFRSLLEWLISHRGGQVKGYTRVIYSGVTTNYLARVVGDILTSHPRLSGLYQVTAPPIPKNELLGMLNRAMKLDIDIVPDDSEVSDRSMVGDAFEAVTGYSKPDWPELVREISADSTPYEKWRLGVYEYEAI